MDIDKLTHRLILSAHRFYFSLSIWNTHLKSAAPFLCTAQLGIWLLLVLSISRDVWVFWQMYGHVIRLWACLLLSDWSFLEYTNGVGWCETVLSLESDYFCSYGGCGKTLQLGNCSVLQQSKAEVSHSTVQQAEAKKMFGLYLLHCAVRLFWILETVSARKNGAMLRVTENLSLLQSTP